MPASGTDATGSAANGGDLGMNARGSLASKPLEDEIFKLKPGELGVVQSEFGFHVVRLAAIQAGKAGSLEDARKDLTAEIAKQIRGGRSVVVGGAGHCPQIEQPAAVNELLLDFLLALREGGT